MLINANTIIWPSRLSYGAAPERLHLETPKLTRSRSRLPEETIENQDFFPYRGKFVKNRFLKTAESIQIPRIEATETIEAIETAEVKEAVLDSVVKDAVRDSLGQRSCSRQSSRSKKLLETAWSKKLFKTVEVKDAVLDSRGQRSCLDSQGQRSC